MSEYYLELFHETNVYKLDELGRVYHLNTITLNWEEVSGVIDYDYSWTQITEDQLHETMLDFYIGTSIYLLGVESKLGKEYRTKKQIGKDFKFYQICSYILCVDENGNQFTCAPDMLIPSSQELIKNEWAELEKCDVIEKIKEQSEVKINEMELFLTPKNDVIAISDMNLIYKQSLYTGYITQCNQKIKKQMDKWTPTTYDYIKENCPHYEKSTTESILQERTDLMIYLEKMNKVYKSDNRKNIGDLTFYRNPFGLVYGINQDKDEVLLRTSEVQAVKKGTVDTKWEIVPPECVINYIQLYTQRVNDNKTMKKITLYDLDLYYNLANEIVGYDKDNKLYKMDNETGDLIKLKSGFKTNEGRRKARVIEAVKKQAECRCSYSLNLYINEMEKNLLNEGKESFGDTVNFYGRIMEKDMEVYAIDSNGCEYICTLDNMTPIARGTIDSSYIQYHDRFVLPVLRYEHNMINERLHKGKKNY